MTQLSPEKLNGRGSNNSVDTSPSRFPRTSSTVRRKEFITPIDLTIRDAIGNKTRLPDDLHGHFFLIAPCGSDIFWNSWGCWPDTITKKAVADYQQYPHRLIPLDEVLDLTYQGVPSSLCHLKIRTDDNNQTKIEIDSENNFQFNKNYLGTSAQFIPRPDAEDQTDGYIACVVLTSDEFLSQSDREDNDPEWSQNTEIWIFNARNLSQGPLYKLSHPKLNIGFSFHTTWIAKAKSPTRLLDYDVREDHEYLVEQLIENEPKLKDKIRKLFDDEIYPHF